MNDLTRFRQIAAEENEVKNACPDCGTPMYTGKFFRTMLMNYCPNCNEFRPVGRQDGNPTSEEDLEF